MNARARSAVVTVAAIAAALLVPALTTASASAAQPVPGQSHLVPQVPRTDMPKSSAGAPLTTFAFTRNTNNPVTAVAATNTTIYVGGRFNILNGTQHTGLAAVNATTGAVDPTFSLNLSGGIGVNGALTVQVLKLTHDE